MSCAWPVRDGNGTVAASRSALPSPICVVPAGHLPTVGEALERLADLRANGPFPRAFTFASAYGAAEAAQELRAAPRVAAGDAAGA
ncbi:DUF3291 domain-containing protein [Streptomyces sp. NPDC013457]|uniref:DUF3291 domain-containing protein n=1 Tax=Streptomyces sp. NPDC013457 TaxID=3364866 RepID=UPI0036FD62D0